METNIAFFRGKEIRKTIHNNEWWFSVADVVEILVVEGKKVATWSNNNDSKGRKDRKH